MLGISIALIFIWVQLMKIADILERAYPPPPEKDEHEENP